MGAVTYPDPKVARLIDEGFIPIQIDVTSEDTATREAIEQYRQTWTPTIIILDPDGQEVRRSQGYFPPEEFVPELKLGLGQVKMLDKDFGGAFEIFEQIIRDYADSKACAEATYWMGVTAYKRDDDPAGLTKHWNELKDKFPNSEWWTKASFIAD